MALRKLLPNEQVQGGDVVKTARFEVTVGKINSQFNYGNAVRADRHVEFVGLDSKKYRAWEREHRVEFFRPGKPDRFEWIKNSLYALGYQDENLYDWFEGQECDKGLQHDLDALNREFEEKFGEADEQADG